MPEYNDQIDKGPEKSGIRLSPRRLLGILFILFILLIVTSVSSVILLRWWNPPYTSYTLQEDWEILGLERYNLRDSWTEPEDIPDHMRWAVIASEDQRFYSHSGLDWLAIEDAMDEMREEGRQRGASTITQQVAKNIYLWPDASYFRKAVEASITLLIEFFWPKERILEVYLNIAEFGPGIFGIGKASMIFFDQRPNELSPEESSRLSAVLPSPKRMRVEPASPYVRERSQWILTQMRQLTGQPFGRINISDSLSQEEKIPVNPTFESDSIFPEDTLAFPGELAHPEMIPSVPGQVNSVIITQDSL